MRNVSIDCAHDACGRLMTGQFMAGQEALGRIGAIANLRSELRKKLGESCEDVRKAQYDMDRAYYFRQRDFAKYRPMYQELSKQIEQMKAKADEAHENMWRCFNISNNAHNRGDKASAKSYAMEGQLYKSERDDFNDEVRRLINNIQSLYESQSAFIYYKGVYDDAVYRHRLLQIEYRKAEEEYEHVQSG